MLYKKDILSLLRQCGIQPTDTVLIHSGLRAIGPMEGNAEGLLEVLTDYLSEGLLIFPTHTWAFITQDYAVFDADKTPSCVGTLSNIARKTPGFLRSMHPTHSVCACGTRAKWYVDHDLTASTPVGVKNCFGILADLDAKILFLGAPLSKNTFIHSIEEEMNVPDRFTPHIYHFLSQSKTQSLEYTMPRHYSTLSAHISEHYEKLLPIFLKKKIAKEFLFGNAISYMVYAKTCHTLVRDILTKDLHAFDSFKDISHLCDL